MNAPFDPVDFVHPLEREGIARGAAEAIAQGIEDRNRELATKADLDRYTSELKGEIAQLATKAESKLELQAALARQTVQVGAMMAAGLGLGTAILGTIIALH